MKWNYSLFAALFFKAFLSYCTLKMIFFLTFCFSNFLYFFFAQLFFFTSLNCYKFLHFFLYCKTIASILIIYFHTETRNTKKNSCVRSLAFSHDEWLEHYLKKKYLSFFHLFYFFIHFFLCSCSLVTTANEQISELWFFKNKSNTSRSIVRVEMNDPQNIYYT